MINLPWFLLISFGGIILTYILYVTGDKKKQDVKEDPFFRPIPVITISISLLLVLYVFRFCIMLFTSLLSELYLVVLTGGIIAFLPILIFFGIAWYNKVHCSQV